METKYQLERKARALYEAGLSFIKDSGLPIELKIESGSKLNKLANNIEESSLTVFDLNISLLKAHLNDNKSVSLETILQRDRKRLEEIRNKGNKLYKKINDVELEIDFDETCSIETISLEPLRERLNSFEDSKLFFLKFIDSDDEGLNRIAEELYKKNEHYIHCSGLENFFNGLKKENTSLVCHKEFVWHTGCSWVKVDFPKHQEGEMVEKIDEIRNKCLGEIESAIFKSMLNGEDVTSALNYRYKEVLQFAAYTFQDLIDNKFQKLVDIYDSEDAAAIHCCELYGDDRYSYAYNTNIGLFEKEIDELSKIERLNKNLGKFEKELINKMSTCLEYIPFKDADYEYVKTIKELIRLNPSPAEDAYLIAMNLQHYKQKNEQLFWLNCAKLQEEQKLMQNEFNSLAKKRLKTLNELYGLQYNLGKVKPSKDIFDQYNKFIESEIKKIGTNFTVLTEELYGKRVQHRLKLQEYENSFFVKKMFLSKPKLMESQYGDIGKPKIEVCEYLSPSNQDIMYSVKRCIKYLSKDTENLKEIITAINRVKELTKLKPLQDAYCIGIKYEKGSEEQKYWLNHAKHQEEQNIGINNSDTLALEKLKILRDHFGIKSDLVPEKEKTIEQAKGYFFKM